MTPRGMTVLAHLLFPIGVMLILYAVVLSSRCSPPAPVRSEFPMPVHPAYNHPDYTTYP